MVSDSEKDMSGVMESPTGSEIYSNDPFAIHLMNGPRGLAHKI